MAVNASKFGGGKPPSKPTGKTGKPASKGSKPKSGKPAYQPIQPGKMSPKPMTIKPPKGVKSEGEYGGNKPHVFGYFRLGIEKRKP